MEQILNNKKDKKIIQDFTSGHVTTQLLHFTVPLFLASALQIVYNTTDMLIVGQFVGSEGLSGVSVGGDISNVFTFLVMGFSNAAQMIISQMIGAGKKESLGRFIGTLISFLAICAVVLTVIGIVFMDTFLGWMNTPAEAWGYARVYAITCMTGMVFIYGYNTISAIFRGMGDSHHPFIFILIASVINIILDLLFTAYLGMGTFGAALATVIGQAVSVMYSIVYFIKHRDLFDFQINRSCLKIDGDMLSMLCNLGIPLAITTASIQLSKLFINSFINSYGVAVSALSGIGSKISMFVNLIASSTSTAGGTMVGQNIGAGNFKRVPGIMCSALAINGFVSCVATVLILLFPTAFFRVFTPDADVLVLSAAYVPVAVTNFISSSLRSSMNTLINGSANYRVSYLVAVFDGIVNRIGFGILLGIVLKKGYMGFWFGDAIASFTPFVIGTAFLISGKWKTNEYITGKRRIDNENGI